MTENAKLEFPRRIQLDKSTPAELAIRAAMHAVEAAGAHPLLTSAVLLLDRAREAVADFVDGVVREPDEARVRHLAETVVVLEAKVAQQSAEIERLRKALAETVIPYEALLSDAPSRKWIAPTVWQAMETATASARRLLAMLDREEA